MATAKKDRSAAIERTTNETSIRAAITIDGTGVYDISTGIGFFDHMLEQLSKHSLIDITLKAEGDLHIDAHHTVEDIGWALGAALKEALRDKRGIARYGHFALVMDEAQAQVALDFSGRPYLVWRAAFSQGRIGEMDTELFAEFFQALTSAAGLTLHVHVLEGTNNHHIIESIFKAVAKSIRMAVTNDPRIGDAVPSTKGVL